MIEALEGFPSNVAAFACHGRVTRNDYDTVLVPAVERALDQHKKVRLYYETAADFDGIDPGELRVYSRADADKARQWVAA